MGYAGTPMALDIAALQQIYGVNTTTAAGNSTYTLPTVNGDGTYWRAIWDTGGTDMIRHAGAGAATIDLRAAPLTGEHAGGYLSRVEGVAGGFTIANGVTIEFAEGGTDNDTITGNDADNEIAGREGWDSISGLGGDDLLDGGAGNDTLNGGSGRDTMIGDTGDDTFLVDSIQDELHEAAGEGVDTVISTVTHSLGANFENLQLAQSKTADIDGYGNALANQIIGNGDANVLEGVAVPTSSMPPPATTASTVAPARTRCWARKATTSSTAAPTTASWSSRRLWRPPAAARAAPSSPRRSTAASAMSWPSSARRSDRPALPTGSMAARGRTRSMAGAATICSMATPATTRWRAATAPTGSTAARARTAWRARVATTSMSSTPRLTQ